LTVAREIARPAAAIQKSMKNRPFVLLDRDGTLIVHWPYLAEPAGVELLPGVVPGLQRLQAAGFGLAIVTNQSGIGRGLFNYDQLYATQDRLLELLMHEGIMIDGVYFCPHAPEDNCACRKPKPRLVQRAAAELGFTPAQSFVIGDSPCDIELARNVGAGAILIRPEENRPRPGFLPHPDHTVSNIAQAADWILRKTLTQKAA
jgi:D-glycero-D-manno-heptose 1,7-bisphosphate phosphatase